jgi:hypothetical protein
MAERRAVSEILRRLSGQYLDYLLFSELEFLKVYGG